MARSIASAVDNLKYQPVILVKKTRLLQMTQNYTYQKNNFSKRSIITGEGWPVTSVMQYVETDFIRIIRIYVLQKWEWSVLLTILISYYVTALSKHCFDEEFQS